MKEIWTDIKGYEGLYQVSNLGRIKSLNFNHTQKSQIMKATVTKGGYLKIHLDKNGERKYVVVHRIVAESFIPNNENHPLVLHKIPVSKGGTNEATNLYWGTYSDNMKDRTRDGHFKNPRLNKFGKDNPTCKPIIQCDLNGNKIKEWDSITQASSELNISFTNIAKCCKGGKYRKTAGGYIWKYKD